MRQKKTYELDGSTFSTLEEFFEVISRVLIPGSYWGKNLDAFNDILRGGFGTPDEGFLVKWINSSISKERLGYPETVRQLEKYLNNCHPSNRESISTKIAKAKQLRGSTVFDWLVEIIEVHCSGGEEAVDGVELILD